MATSGGGTGPFNAGALVLKKMGQALITKAGAPTNGTSGTGAGKAGLGCVCYDYTNGIRYTNVGTKASPTWSPLSPVLFALTAANIIAMFTTPVNLIAAPPAGFAVVVQYVLFIMTTTATQFTSGGAVAFVYTGGSVQVHASTIPATTVTATAGTTLTLLGPAVATNGTAVPTATGVDITNGTGVFATGTGTAKVRIRYDVVKQS